MKDWKYETLDKQMTKEISKECKGIVIPVLCTQCKGTGLQFKNELCDNCDGKGDYLFQY